MDLTKLKKYLEHYSPLPEKDWEYFISRVQRRTFPKKASILAAGVIENYVNFIDSGIIRYFVREEEKDITFEIAFENSFATAYDSFLTRTPVIYEAETLTDVVLYSICYDDLQEIYALTSVGDRIGRKAAEELYIRKNRRQMSFLKDDAEQRYRGLMSDYPHLLQHVPLKYLASYIAITPQALSRIRRRISRTG
jgi:CRP-like cAMP-binding protein